MARKRLAVVPSGHTVLVIDDQDSMLTSMRLLLEHEGHTVRLAQSGAAGLTSFREQLVHLVIVDYRMPEMNGEEVIHALRRLDAHVPILLQSGDTGEQDVRTLLYRLDIQGFHDKGDGPEQLLEWVNALLNAAPRRPRNETPRPRFSHILEDCLPSALYWPPVSGRALAA